MSKQILHSIVNTILQQYPLKLLEYSSHKSYTYCYRYRESCQDISFKITKDRATRWVIVYFPDTNTIQIAYDRKVRQFITTDGFLKDSKTGLSQEYNISDPDIDLSEVIYNYIKNNTPKLNTD